ncbi:MAG: SUMF1/EgtB/PvdO family nonheme iron enzyme [Minicystis sp.]
MSRRPLFLAAAALALGCSTGPSESAPGPSGSTTASASAPAPRVTGSAAPPAPPPPPADAGSEAGGPADDPMAFHFETREELLALFSIKRPPKPDSNADGFLQKSFGPGSPALINQGNKALAKHSISKAKCLAGLEGVTLQTEEQKAICGGFENMVPVWKRGKKPKYCIDIFEFPNKPCELPLVWVAPVQAKVICELQGKRLCSQEEWTLSCNADPEGGKPTKFAYGDEMNLDTCNTNKPAATYGPGCDAKSATSAWKTCSTNTEPTGSFPKCRSRFGVYDLHGNVAEIMTRLDPDGHTYDQLKGSAFFYTDVARGPNERPPKGRETYPDHCAYDPRWHVELMSEAWHNNYHLGFRCCKTVR